MGEPVNIRDAEEFRSDGLGRRGLLCVPGFLISLTYSKISRERPHWGKCREIQRMKRLGSGRIGTRVCQRFQV